MTHTAASSPSVQTRRLLAVAIALAALSGAPEPVVAAPARRATLDPRLAAAQRSDEPVAVWITFRDKGERSPGDLAEALARAEAALTPRSRSRRARAQVSPFVDAYDLPVAGEYLAALASRGITPLATSRWLNRVAVRVPGAQLDEIADWRFVERVAPVERVLRSRPERVEALREETHSRRGPARLENTTSCTGVAGPEPGRTFDALSQIGLLGIQACGYSGAGVLVCVIDDGFNGSDTHEALRDRVALSGHMRDFVDGDSVAIDPTGIGHGVGTYGILAGLEPGVYVGSAYGADFALARTEVNFSEQPVEMLYWGMAAEWADSLGADVISSSLGYFVFQNPGDSYTYAQMDGATTEVSRAARIAAAKGILVVNAVGNEGNTVWHYLIAPGDVNGDSVLAVGAINLFGERASFSSFGPSADGRIKPDLVALGQENAVVFPGLGSAGYGSSSGTSYSAPLVAGLAACILEARPDWTPVQVIRALRETASQAVSPDNRLGYGIPDGRAALAWTPESGPAPPRLGLSVRHLGANPARGPAARTRVEFGLTGQSSEPVEGLLHVVDAGGRELRRLWSGSLCGGERHSAEWDGTDRDGRGVPAGIYWISLRGSGETAATRVVRVR